MKKFMGKNFLLNSKTAKKLYHNYSKVMPIVDYHCHINPKEIALDHKFENITQVWLGGDHYKWRLMRSNGISEKYITGDASDREKFQKWAETLEKSIGNPLFHWSHLELKRFFGYDGILGKDTAQHVWDICNKKLQEENMSVRNIIKNSNVKLICTTDDPIDDLKWHKMILEDESFDVRVLPTWRPDKAMNIEKETYLEYIKTLSDVSNVKIERFVDLKNAIINRMDYFNKLGCKISDHGLDYVMYEKSTDEEIEEIFSKRLSNQAITEKEIKKFKTAFMIFCAKEYYRLDWVMQLHFGCKRDNNTYMFNKLGPDTGYDCINNYTPIEELSFFLNELNIDNKLTRTILYSLNPNDDALIDTIMGCFQNSEAMSKIQHGSAWWFNDTKIGMEKHITTLASLGMLSNFVGMLTDSRSFLSYTRHEYFRRILCNIIGELVENGEYPNNISMLGEIVRDISYNNSIRYFNFSI